MAEPVSLEDFNEVFGTTFLKSEEDIKAFALRGGEDELCLCPYLKDGFSYLIVNLSLVKSNITIYQILLSGCDDVDATKDFLSLGEALKEVSLLKREGISGIWDRGYYSH